MALQKQTIDIPFLNGANENVSEHILPPDQFAVFRNLKFNKTGELVPRPAFSEIATTNSIVPSRFVARTGELVVASNGNTSSDSGLYSLQNNGDSTKTWVKKADLPEYINERTPAVRDLAFEVTDCDGVSGVNYDVVAFYNPRTTYLTVRLTHKQSGQITESILTTVGANHIMCELTSDGYAGIFYRDSAKTSLYYNYINTNTGYINASRVLIASSLDADRGFDICSGGDHFYVVYSTTNILRLRYTEVNGTNTWAYNAATTASDHRGVYAIKQNELGDVWVAFWDGNLSETVKMIQFNSNFTSITVAEHTYITLPQEVRNVVGISIEFCSDYLTSGTPARMVAVSQMDKVDLTAKTTFRGDNYGTNTGGNTYTYTREVLASKLWSVADVNGKLRVYGYFLDYYTPCYHLLELIPGDNTRGATFGQRWRPVTSAAYAEADRSARPNRKLQSVSNSTENSLAVAKTYLPVLISVPVGSNADDPDEDYMTGFDLLTAKRLSNDAWQSIEVDGITYIGGGILLEYDGKNLYENGYIQDPWVSWIPYASGYMPPSDEVISTGMIYEWTDYRGRRHQSQTANWSIRTGNNLTTYSRHFMPLTVTLRTEDMGSVLCSLFSTLKNGSEYYRAFAIESSGTSVSSVLDNTWGVSYSGGFRNSRTFSGDMLFYGSYAEPPTYRETLYSQPGNVGELSHFAVFGGCTHMTFHKGRLWVVSAEKPRRLIYSKPSSSDAPIQFYPPGFTIDLPDVITGIASFNDVLIAFTSDKVYLISGNGPDYRGAGEFEQPYPLPGDLGCINWRSIIDIPEGVLFETRSGVKLLTRKFEMVDIADAVVSALDGMQKLSVNNYYEESEIRIVGTNDDGDGGVIIVWNYEEPERAKWSVWESNLSFIDGRVCIIDGVRQFCCLTSDGMIVTDNNNYSWDLNSEDNAFTCQIRTGWLNLGKISEYKRLYKIGLQCEASNAHNVRIEIQNADGNSTQTKEFLWSEINTTKSNRGGTRQTVPLVTGIANGLSRAFRITISSSKYVPVQGYPATNPNYPAFKWMGFSFEVGLKPGIRKR